MLGCIALLADTLKLAPDIIGDEFARRGCSLGVKLLRWLESLPVAVCDGELLLSLGLWSVCSTKFRHIIFAQIESSTVMIK